MKKWVKYLTSTIVFGFLYTMAEYLLSKDINWKMVIVTIIIYIIFYIIADLVWNKLLKKINYLLD